MFKKNIFFLVTVLLIGVMVAPYIQAQDYSQMERELTQVQQDLQAGKITPIQAQQRIAEIQQKYLGMSDATVGGGSPRGSTGSDAASQAQNQQLGQQANRQALQALQSQQAQQQEQQEDTLETGQFSGWPSSSIFTQCSMPNLRQPSGTTVSYNYDSQTRTLNIYIRGGTQNHVAELTRAIEAGGKVVRKVDGTLPILTLPAPSGARPAVAGTRRDFQEVRFFLHGKAGIELWSGDPAFWQ